ncbi:MAG: hypothetical protein K0R96_2486 [Pantoea agglomerans]|nr:hypothetical protein [Pantoea agglomerans]
MNNTTYVQDYNAIVAVLNQYNEGGKRQGDHFWSRQ